MELLKRIIYPPYDKLLHFYIATLASVFIAVYLCTVYESKYKPSIVIIVGIASVIWEYLRYYLYKHKFDWNDVAISILPSVLITIIMYLN
jgi:hypothetical protein